MDRPPASKRGVRQTQRSDVPQQHTCTNISRCMETGLPASTINLQACRCLGKEKKTGANTQTFLSDAEHICRLSEVTRESTDSALKNIKPALKNQPKRTTGACRLGSPSGPHSFTHHAVSPQPLFCSPKASQPAQMCSCLCEVGI